MFDMAFTRPSLTVQLTSDVDVFAHVCGQKRTLRATIVTIYDSDNSVFVKCDTFFRLFFFVNYHKFELLIFAR